jgi:hypothetical protein
MEKEVLGADAAGVITRPKFKAGTSTQSLTAFVTSTKM